ncbi:hypothetical protein FGB62_21g25 [Gracilaria domingensis]|nr:hypothetical protein FGB62_21g25 [Gracilaria domingensis]
MRALDGSNAGMVPSNVAMGSMAPNASEAVATGGKQQLSADMHNELFWDKLEEIRRKYMGPLNHLLPIIQRIHHKDSPSKEQFFKFLQDCITVLALKRETQKPERFDFGVLQRTESFLNGLIQAYTVNHGKSSPNMREGLESNAAAAASAMAAVAGKAVEPPSTGRGALSMQATRGKGGGTTHASTQRLDAGQLAQAQPAAQAQPQNAQQKAPQQARAQQQLGFQQQQRSYHYGNQQRMKLLNELNMQADAHQMQSGVQSRQARGGVAAGTAGVDGLKLAAAKHAHAQEVASRMPNARARQALQRGVGRVQGDAGWCGGGDDCSEWGKFGRCDEQGHRSGGGGCGAVERVAENEEEECEPDRDERAKQDGTHHRDDEGRERAGELPGAFVAHGGETEAE